MHIVYIHGATASSKSFAFIQSKLKSKHVLNLEYDKDTPANYNLDRMIDKLANVKDELYFICHSLGGIYAIYLQKEFEKYTQGVCSLATPFNGSEVATWSNLLLPHYQLFKDITPNSEFIANSKRIHISIPWTQFVTTLGDVPWLIGENDGIVTRASMTCRDDVDYIPLERNHYEVLQSDRVMSFLTQTHTRRK